MKGFLQRIWQGAFEPAGIFVVASLAGRFFVMAVMRLRPNLLSRRTWKVILWISSIVLAFSIIYLMYGYIMPLLQGLKYKGPIILTGLGVILLLIFSGAGVIWFFIQQSSILERSNEVYDITKIQSRLYVLRKNLRELEKLIHAYDEEAPKNYDRFLDPNSPYNINPCDFESILQSINLLSKIYFNQDLKLNEIDEKYNDNYHFNEENYIKDIRMRGMYKKERSEYLSNKNKLDKFLSKYKRDIIQSERFIDDYVKVVN